jgi:SpoIID/LytB domain protein
MRRPRAAARSATLGLALVVGLLVPVGPGAAGATAAWPVATDGPTTLTSGIWFRGRGWGHGVGLSQHGARGRALAGQDHVTILAHYYAGTTLGSVDPATQVRVRVLSGFTPTASNPFQVIGRSGPFTVDGLAGTFPADARVRLTKAATGWLLRVTSASGVELARRNGVTFARVRPASATSLLQLPPRTSSYDTYRGYLSVRAGTTISVINVIGLDLYLRGVVPAEMPASWPKEALRAQAIAARSYAVRRLHPTTGSYDLTDGTSSQVYLGREREAAATNAAIADTAGVVVKSGSSVANTLFHSTAGGATEHNENVFVSSTGATLAGPVSYLRGRPDTRPDGTPYDDGSPYAYWKTDTYDIASLSRIFAADARTNVGTLVSLDLSARGVSGRLIKVVLRGSAGSKTVSGDVFRAVFNVRNAAGRPDLRSTLVDLVQDPAGLRVSSATRADPFATP